MVARRGGMEKRDGWGVWDGNVHIAIFKKDNQQGPTLQHRELCSVIRGSLNARGVWGRMDTCICTAETLSWPPETITILLTSCSVQLLSCVRLFALPWTAAHQASLSITNSWTLLKLTSIELVMPSNNLILCCPLLLLPSIIPNIRVFSNESVLCIRWSKYWSFSFSTPI